MSSTTSDPIDVLGWALENLSPGEVVRSSQVRQSFQKFLKRGTLPQLQQLLEEVQGLQVPSATQDDLISKASHDTVNTHPASGYGRTSGSKRKASLSDQPFCPRRASKICRIIDSNESITPVQTPSDTVPSSSSPSYSDMAFSSTSPGYCAGTPKNSPSSSRTLNHSSLEPGTIQSDLPIPSPYSDILSNAKSFFNSRLGTRSNRIHYLIRAIQGFLSAPKPSPDFEKDMWGSRSPIFTQSQVSGLNARLRNLYDGHRRIKQAREQYSYAARFCYIYLEHDLEELSKSQSLVLSQGRGRMTAVFDLQAEIISTSVEVVKAERKAGRGYLQLLMEGGPGFILRLGCNVSTLWERKLSASDISLIIEFLKTQAPDLHEEVKSYDKCATQALLRGFIAYGWTQKDILASKSSMFEGLKQYVDLEDIFEHQARDETLRDLSEITFSCGYGITPQYSFDFMSTPIATDFDLDSSFTPSDLPLTPGKDNPSTPENQLLSPEIMSEISRIPDAELDKLFSVEMEPFTPQINEVVDYQLDALLRAGILDELDSGFSCDAEV